ncbi:MAG: hypothetical protein QOE68_4509, partial [Thermoanaerobaculia bacterium]|nr:hypothetical protein [Thermoanaerobaculia bacterium]
MAKPIHARIPLTRVASIVSAE